MVRWVMAFLGLLPLLGGAAPSVELVLPGLDGKPYRLSDYRGQWVVVNYWSTTCPPCLKEIPELSRFHDRHKDEDAVVLGIDYEEIPRLWLKEFSENRKISYPVLLGPPGAPTPLGPVVALPSTFLVSPDGEVIGRHVGPVTAKALEAFLQERSPQAAGAGR